MKKIVTVILILAVFGAAIAAMSNMSFAQSFLNRDGDSAEEDTVVLPAVTAPDTVLAEAMVVPLREADLSLPTSGVVAEVFVAEGEAIRAGDNLVRLENTRQQAAVAQAEANLLNAEMQLAELMAPPRAQEIARAQAGVAAAQASLQKVLDGARDIELTSARVDLANAEAALREAQAAYDDVAWRTDVGMLPQSTALEQATNNYVRAQAALEDVQAGADQTDIASAQAQVRSAQAELDLLQAGATAQTVAAAEAQVKVAQAALEDARAALEQTTLRAPFDGTLALVGVEVGEQVSPGVTVAKLADLSEWRIETDDLTELSVVRVQEGDTVDVRIDALPDVEMTGHVQSIRPLGENKLGDITYTVVVTLDDQDERLRWNMTAETTILPGTAPTRGIGSAAPVPPAADEVEDVVAASNTAEPALAAEMMAAAEVAETKTADAMLEIVLAGNVATSGAALNVRSGPGLGFPVIAGLENGATIEATGRSADNGWLKVTLADGDVGWVARDFVTLNADVRALRVTDELIAPPQGTVTETSNRVGEQPALEPAVSSAPAETASTSFPAFLKGVDGTLVFKSSSGGMIYAYDLESGELRSLTYGLDPSLSPDGSTVAFVREGGEHGLYLIDIDGSNERLIFSGGENFRAPSWSPDGEWIVFSRKIGTYGCRDVGGGICLPDNRFLDDFTLVDQTQTMLSRVDTNGQNFRDLPSLNTARAATWGDAGIVYQSAAGLQITGDSPNAQTLPVAAQYRYQDPDLQMNGDRVVFHSLEGNHREIFTVGVDGSGLRALTRPSDLLAKEYAQNVAPVWSPDGQWIAFLSNRAEDGSVGDWGIWVMDADGGNLSQLPLDAPIAYDFQNEQVLSW